MRGKKFISLTLSTMLCLQLLPTASFAAAPATDTGNAGLIAEGDYAIAGNGVRVTYDADGQTITLYRTEGSGLLHWEGQWLEGRRFRTSAIFHVMWSRAPAE